MTNLNLKQNFCLFQAEDEKQKERISAKNNLESYCFNMKSTLDDEKLKDKISESDRETITKKCDEIIKWLDANQLAEVSCFSLFEIIEVYLKTKIQKFLI